MIKNQISLSMAESLQYIEKDKDKSNIVGFIKKFTNLNSKDAKEFKEDLEKLDLIKMKPDHISKIIDIMPLNNEDLNKIFSGISLDEDETKKILEIVNKFK